MGMALCTDTYYLTNALFINKGPSRKNQLGGNMPFMISLKEKKLVGN